MIDPERLARMAVRLDRCARRVDCDDVPWLVATATELLAEVNRLRPRQPALWEAAS